MKTRMLAFVAGLVVLVPLPTTASVLDATIDVAADGPVAPVKLVAKAVASESQD